MNEVRKQSHLISWDWNILVRVTVCQNTAAAAASLWCHNKIMQQPQAKHWCSDCYTCCIDNIATAVLHLSRAWHCSSDRGSASEREAWPPLSGSGPGPRPAAARCCPQTWWAAGTEVKHAQCRGVGLCRLWKRKAPVLFGMFISGHHFCETWCVSLKSSIIRVNEV